MKYIVTGGAGFIGSNTARRLLEQGQQVVVIDNLSRPGSPRNLEWLIQAGGDLEFLRLDIRDADALQRAVRAHASADVVLHFAAQVAVTTSVTDPRTDFEINALGTFNLLEALRAAGTHPTVLFTSTNKVYGELAHLRVEERETRYALADLPQGVDEATPLDFYSPYGCSKGAADQYVHDYGRIFGLPTVVFRNSCIYGTRQFGVEDQGWLAWFVIAAARGLPISIYGDGKQVRDALFIDDLVELMLRAVARPDVSAGQVYNVGGGPARTVSVWKEFGPMLEGLLGGRLPVTFHDWRPGDQKVYVSDIRKASRHFDWEPKVDVGEGVRRLHEWVRANRRLFDEGLPTASPA
jgi:CDP-paratose 2-epimerase